MVVILAPVVLASGHRYGHMKYRGMKEPEDLGSGYSPALSLFRNMQIVVGKLWKSIME
jgi:hypothetical protein